MRFARIIANLIKNSTDNKNLVANIGYLSLLKIAGYLFPLITMPYLARTIGVDGFGKISFAMSVVIWFQTLSDWGFNLTATRDVSQNKNDTERISHIFSDVLWARCLLTCASALLLLGLCHAVPVFHENRAIIWCTFLLVPGHILFPEWFFQAIEKMKYMTIFNICIKTIFTLSVFIFIRNEDDFILQPIISSVGYGVCGIGAMWIILKKWKIQLYKPDFHAIFYCLQNSIDVFINNIFPNLYNSFSILLLGIFGGATANGVFDGGNKLPNIMYEFQSVLSRAFYPYLARRENQHTMYVLINMSLSIAACLLLVVFASPLIRIILGAEFADSVPILRILAVSYVFVSLGNCYGTNYLIIYHHEQIIRRITIIASLIGFAISIPMVYNFTCIGAAITILISRIIMGLLSYCHASKIKNAKI